ncbi:putative inorganic carbon transporter subunit DabA [Niallia sp.]|uniref:DUF2309 domain-containing protein n=1 Tax=Niallia sp. TaxID=2837523 RepID=UPI002898C1A5|nr:putative inorganic carbon transporter subunit DabA [Niallia sp.]
MSVTSVLTKENSNKKEITIDFIESNISSLVETASKVIAPLWPISTFAARHPWMGLEKQSFDQVAGWLKNTRDVDIYPSASMILSAKNKGEINEAFVKQGLQCWLDSNLHTFSLPRDVAERFCHAALKLEPIPTNLLSSTELKKKGEEYSERIADTIDHSSIQPISSQIENQDRERLINILDYHVIKWCKLYLDDSQAGWEMPHREEGFFRSWHRLVCYDPALSKSQRESLKSWPEEADSALENALKALNIPETEIQSYLEAHLLSLPGWAGMMLWRSNQSSEENALLTEYLAVRISLEWALIHPYLPFRNKQLKKKESIHSLLAAWIHWGSLSLEEWSHKSCAKQQEYLLFAAKFDEKLCRKLWLEAWEQTHAEQLKQKIISNQSSNSEKDTALAQFVFCIDVRSEPFRRQLEKEGPFETIGMAGFFGVPIATNELGCKHSHPSLPIMNKPLHKIIESTEENDLISFQQRKQAVHSLSYTFKTMKQNLLASLLLPELSGPFLSLQMVARSFMPKSADRFIHNVRKTWLRKPKTSLVLNHVHPTETGIPIGFSEGDKVNYARQALKMMGITDNFSPLVVICGHGSQSTNNPYASSLECGACGGASGGFNARVLATLCNLPEVRKGLSLEGIAIPDETVFVAAEHNTTVDELHWIYVPELSKSAQVAFQRIEAILPRVCHHANEERLAKLPHFQSKHNKPKSEAYQLAEDWSVIRPEWGLAGNAAFIIGQRELTNGCDLEGRVFLHNYNWQKDRSGELLDTIISGPGTVAQWINLEYYASTVAPHYYGSGNKATQTVTAGLGVMQGNASDLLTGLPWQSVMQSDNEAYHSPLRLLIVIQAPKEYVERLLKNNAVFQQKVQNGWVRLASVDPEGHWQNW